FSAANGKDKKTAGKKKSRITKVMSIRLKNVQSSKALVIRRIEPVFPWDSRTYPQNFWIKRSSLPF
ncbi:TPA: hypothetical protein I7721_22030, partial [Vibrio vulnificus]|nr:hypothetical protein [Vibrio vulnificus]